MTWLIRFLTIAAAMLASGCVSDILATDPPKPRYMVGAVDPSALAGAPVDWSLIVEAPGASRAYDTTKIAVSPAPGRLEYFGGGEWASRAPVVLQTALIRAFEDSERILAVGKRPDLALGDFVLQTDIRRIDLDVSGGQRIARLEVYARLTNGRSIIHAAEKFDAAAPAASLSGDDAAAAFNAAFNEVIAEIAAWAFEAGNQAQSADSEMLG